MGKVSTAADLSRSLRQKLGVTQAELATRLLVSRNYVSQIEANLKTPSRRLRTAMEELLKESASPDADKESGHLKRGGLPGRVDEEETAYSGAVASRLSQKREPSTRADCENYFARLMDAADLSDDPNAFPVILHRLKKEFPLEEWEQPPIPEQK